MFAVIKSGGRQFKVEVGETLQVNRLPVQEGTQIRISEVLLLADANRTVIGRPLVENASVLATVRQHARGDKIVVFKYKSKKRYRRRKGHRQEISILTIDDILLDGVSLVTGQTPTEAEQGTPVSGAALQPATEERGAAAETPASASEEEGQARTRRRRRVRSQEGEASQASSEE
ncbi:MAG: 50S ribosomal protein L21 [Thermogemmatispora sp.]|uniref:50S ribosomal protein L21 n=1 Tax=Thermogemmatispora sp. TaxID=1968838 RepID=UPI00261331F3|nr:50S ribosomal protein L21 [Thermogemmatispora sp.]MBX5456092.1 50S ribosomal protein L21 [Thermogemmatispora sp.]